MVTLQNAAGKNSQMILFAVTLENNPRNEEAANTERTDAESAQVNELKRKEEIRLCRSKMAD